MIQNSIRPQKSVRWITWLLAAVMVFACIGPAMADDCTDLAELPLMVSSVLSPPPLFMISFDNSGTMDYETMANDGVDDAQFADPVSGDPYPHVFYTSQHNQNAPVVELQNPGAWKSQWAGHNKLYYNPAVNYDPWPGKSNADLSFITDPMGDTYDLTPTYDDDDFMTGVKMAKVERVPDVDQKTTNPDNQGTNGYIAEITVDTTEAVVSVSQEVTSLNNGSSSDEISVGWVKFIDSAGNTDAIVEADDAVREPDGAGDWIKMNGTWVTDGEPGQYSATWNVTGLDPGETYQVKVYWDKFEERSDDVTYNIYYDSGETVNIKRRHFYVKSAPADVGDGNFYLVNLVDSDTARFYRVDEEAGTVDEVIEDYELIETAWAELPGDLRDRVPEPAAGAYTAQLQNFANWFKYYRKRTFAAKNAVARVVSDMSNILMGMTTSPSTTKIGVRWIDSEFGGVSLDNTDEFLNALYDMGDPGSESKFTATILDIGTYYEESGGNLASNNDIDLLTQNPSTDDPFATKDTYPFFTESWGGQCQQSFALIITDGGSVGSSNINDYDSGSTDSKTDPTEYDGGMFADIDETTDTGSKKGIEDTMADGAMHYYERDLKPNLRDVVPANYMDLATHQHMVTYGITFGAQGEIDRSQYPNCTAACAGGGCECPHWPDPHDEANGPNRGLDDLWHATVNGRGLYMNAADPQELIEKLREIKADIDRRAGSAAAVATNAVQRQYGATIYQGRYDSRDWEGDLRALQVDMETGNIGSFVWTYDGEHASAGDLLNHTDPTGRRIFTHDGSGGIAFTAGNAGSIPITADEIDYLRGDHSNEQKNGGDFRDRDYKLSDIVNSEPFFYKGVVYIGANDAMLHAFDAETGNELFAYVPEIVYDKLDAWNDNGQVDLTEPTYDHQTGLYVDATPHVEKIDDTTYLAAGLGKGGKGVYSLTVDNAKTVSDQTAGTAADLINWEFDTSDETGTPNDLGYVYGRAYVVETNAGPAVIFGNGYNSDSEEAVLYVMHAADQDGDARGEIMRKFEPQDGTSPACNGMSSPAIIDYDLDGIVDYVYAGDLKGNLWKFDLTAENSSDWTTAYGGEPLFQAKDGDTPQPITCEPDVMFHCDNRRNGFIVAFGTGKLLGGSDLFDTSQQTFYAIYDWQRDGGTAPFGAFDGETIDETAADLSNVSQTLLKQEYLDDQVSDVDGETYRKTSDYPIDYHDPENPDESGNHVGWYMNMPQGSGEKIVANPMIRDGVVTFVSNKIEASGCKGAGTSYLYFLDACDGGQPEPAQFDINSDDEFDENDTVDFDGDGEGTNPSGKAYDTILYRPVQVGDQLYVNDTLGSIQQSSIPSNPTGMKYWNLIE